MNEQKKNYRSLPNYDRLVPPYDCYMAREHINNLSKLLEILKFYFPKSDLIWWPLRVQLSNREWASAGKFYV